MVGAQREHSVAGYQKRCGKKLILELGLWVQTDPGLSLVSGLSQGRKRGPGLGICLYSEDNEKVLEKGAQASLSL